MKQITKNFNEAEFKCKCCGTIKYDEQLVIRLQILRNLIGVPLIITSGYRCPAYNKRVNGHKNSNHMSGLAADIYPSDRSKLAELIRLADLVFYDGGIGRYKTFVHVDTGKFLRFSGI